MSVTKKDVLDETIEKLDEEVVPSPGQVPFEDFLDSLMGPTATPGGQPLVEETEWAAWPAE